VVEDGLERFSHRRRHPRGGACAAVVALRRSSFLCRLEEPTSRVSPRATSTASPCGSINVRERPWASKRQPINYERRCTDRLNSQG
jgi:hypothetical protein